MTGLSTDDGTGQSREQCQMYSERRLIPLVRDIVRPLELEGWGMFRVEQFLASLEDSQLKQALQNELFERWLTAKIQTMVVKLLA